MLLLAAALTAACTVESGQGGARDEGSAPAIVTHTGDDHGLTGTLASPQIDRPAQVLRDDRGQPFSVAERPGDELTVLFFGYTHCPDVCPTTMADLARARAMVDPALRDRVKVAFVTEDPQRDTRTELRRWLDGFDPQFVGLRGGNASTKAMLEELYSSATGRVERPEEPIRHPENGHAHDHHGSYGIEHTSIIYVFAPGDRSVIYTGDTTAGEYAADFERLLAAD